MKRIGIDARLYFQTGVGTYLRNLLHYLQNLDTSNFEFYIYHLPQDSQKIIFEKENFIKREVAYPWHSIKEQLFFAKVLEKDNLDLMHFTYFSYPVFYKRNFIATIHDVTPLLFKTGQASTKNSLIFGIKHAGLQFALSQQVKNSSFIITPTKTVKKQLIDLYSERFSEKIMPMYEGINYELLKERENLADIKKLPNDYILYVGNFYPHKNVENLIHAWKKVPSNTKLILAGPTNFFSNKIKELVKELSLQQSILFFPSVTNSELIALYKYAKALINPSLSEGFGLPLVESMYFSTPIIASDISVFNELLGDSFIKFDPNSVIDISEKVNSFLKNPISFQYSAHLEKYSFEKMTQQTLELYQKALQK